MWKNKKGDKLGVADRDIDDGVMNCQLGCEETVHLAIWLRVGCIWMSQFARIRNGQKS